MNQVKLRVMTMNFATADRLTLLPPYLFAELDRMRDEVAAKGVDIIDLGVGDPDLPTPNFVLDAMNRAVQDDSTHHYPDYAGMGKFKKAASVWLKKRFNQDLDPAKEVIALIGSKEGLAHFPFAFLNPGDVLLAPSPAYPVYHNCTLLAGGVPYEMPLLKQNGFLQDLDAIPADVLKKSKVLVVNYPNNPTAACADLAYYEKVVAFAKEHGLIVVSDAAYSEMSYDGFVPPSILEVEGAKDVAIEFHSLSKTFNMTGWRIGFAAGNASLVAGLGRVKSQIDSGAFNAVQEAGIAAMEDESDFLPRLRERYQARRDVMVEGLAKLGLEVDPPKATFYIWCPCPKGMSSADFAALCLNQCGVVGTPGNGFGAPGEGFVRFALTVGRERLKEALDRLGKLEI